MDKYEKQAWEIMAGYSGGALMRRIAKALSSLAEKDEEIKKLRRIEAAAIAYCLTNNSADKAQRLAELSAALSGEASNAGC
jgi:hypothetical protein